MMMVTGMRMTCAVAALLLVATAPTAAATAATATATTTKVKVQFGDEISSHVQAAVEALLKSVGNVDVTMLSASTNAGAASTLVCGNTTHARSVVPDHEVAALEPEGYIVRAVRQADNTTLVVARGRAPSKLQFDPHYKHMLGRGSVYACYDALQQLGFAFLHPLRVEKPVDGVLDLARVKNTTSEPRWRLRGFHIHTEHPLELTDMLTGFDITVNGTVVEKWEDMVPDFERYLQWSVAHRLNRVEWLSLFAKDWAWYGFSAQRQARFRNLTSLCHAYATHAGVDAAIAEEQQHAMTLVDPAALLNTTEGDVTIHQRMRWLAACGFDYISTENGLSEFTHPNDKLMLHWINVTTEAASGVDMGAYIKCHISSGQYCKHYVDPDTGKPLNFNYLPILADERMGIMPHTVQFYSHDDPANTYGNANFTGMFDFMFRQLGKAREVVYHPETAYWVNFDVDVPLFLPLYALGRVRDLRRIKSEEHSRTTAAAAAERVNNAGDGIGGGGGGGDGVGDGDGDGDGGGGGGSGKRVRLDGHMNFDSGWEWSYWVQDVATADMFWDVCGDHDGCDTDVSALSVLFGRIAAAFGATAGPMVRDWLLTYAQQQHRLLVLGHWNKSAPLPTQDTAYAKRNGQAYIQGWDAMADLSSWAVPDDATQPNKLDFNAARLDMEPNYWTEVRPLLAAMNATFGEAFAAVKNIQRHIPAARAHIFQDLVDSAHMTFLRAQQVYALYDFAATGIDTHGQTQAWRKARLAEAKAALNAAVVVVASREQQYRVPLHRVGAWRKGPTAYGFGYLWTVHSLYYFWRDHAKATLATPETLSPCFRNIQNIVDIGVGEGRINNVTQWVYDYLEKHAPGLDFITDCLDPPRNEPHYGW